MSLFDPFVIIHDRDLARSVAITSTALLDIALIQNVIAFATFIHFNKSHYNQVHDGKNTLRFLNVAWCHPIFLIALVLMYTPVYMVLFKKRDHALAIRHFGNIQLGVIIMQVGGVLTEVVGAGYGKEGKVVGILGWYIWPVMTAMVPGLGYLTVKYWWKVYTRARSVSLE